MSSMARSDVPCSQDNCSRLCVNVSTNLLIQPLSFPPLPLHLSEGRKVWSPTTARISLVSTPAPTRSRSIPISLSRGISFHVHFGSTLQTVPLSFHIGIPYRSLPNTQMIYAIIAAALLFTTSVRAPPPPLVIPAADASASAFKAAEVAPLMGKDATSSHLGETLDLGTQGHSHIHVEKSLEGESIHPDINTQRVPSKVNPRPLDINLESHAGNQLSIHGDSIPTRLNTQVPLMGEQDVIKINEAYYNGRNGKRIIISDHDGTLKSFDKENGPQDSKALRKAMKKLAAHSNNEVWIVTARDVGEIEEFYGKIPGVNVAGRQGQQLGRKNLSKLKFPDKGPMDGFHQNYLDIEKELELGKIGTAHKYNYMTRVIFDLTPETKEAIRSRVLEAQKRMEQIVQGHPDGNLYSVKFQEIPRQGSQPEKFDLTIVLNQAEDKGFIPKLLFEQNDVRFGVSLGDMEMDEAMHAVMRQHGQSAILVKDPTLGPEWVEEHAWNSHASYSLSNHQNTLKFLESLQKTPEKKGYNPSEHSGWHNIKTLLRAIWQSIKRKIKAMRKQ